MSIVPQMPYYKDTMEWNKTSPPVDKIYPIERGINQISELASVFKRNSNHFNLECVTNRTNPCFAFVFRTDGINPIETLMDSNLLNLPYSQKDLTYAIDIKKRLEGIIAEEGLDYGVSYTLKRLKGYLLEKDYSVCDVFVNLLGSSILDFDLRLHISVLTFTFHWKSHLAFREEYFLRVEEYVNRNFSQERSSQILSGLK